MTHPRAGAARHDAYVIVEMTETITYQRSFTLTELAALLDVPPTLAGIQQAIDVDNADYGTRDPDDECLLDALLPADAPFRHLLGVEDRGWTITWPAPADTRTGQPR